MKTLVAFAELQEELWLLEHWTNHVRITYSLGLSSDSQDQTPTRAENLKWDLTLLDTDVGYGSGFKYALVTIFLIER